MFHTHLKYKKKCCLEIYAYHWWSFLNLEIWYKIKYTDLYWFLGNLIVQVAAVCFLFI